MQALRILDRRMARVYSRALISLATSDGRGSIVGYVVLDGVPQPIEDRPRASESRFQFGHQIFRAHGVPFAPDVLEPHRQVIHFVCPNCAGNAAQRVRRALQRVRIAGRGSPA